MNRTDMMNKISETLQPGDSVEIKVTNARGRTLVHYYNVTSIGHEFTHQKWGGRGNLRDEYKARVLDV